MSTHLVASFEDGDEQYVVIGSDPYMLPVYRVDETAGACWSRHGCTTRAA